MSKTNENKLVPKLRFPEFKKDGEWANEELGQISEIVRGGSPRPIQEYLTKEINGLNWLKIADVPSDSKYITGTKEKVINEALSSTREVNPGDLILSNSMSFGRPYILKIKTCIHDGWIAIRKISNKTFEDYLYYFISSENSQSYFTTNAAGAAVKNLNADIIKLLPIYLPKNKKEQQKIAACLSSLDEVLTAESQKLELLKKHKKGLLQNLFPQEGEIVPKLRFKEFEDSGEWKEKMLGNMGEFTGGGTPSRGNTSFWEGDIPWISSSDIDDESIYSVIISRFISDEALKISATKIVPANSILLVSRVGVGKLAITIKPICTSQDFTNFTPKNDDLVFLAYCLKNRKKTLLGFSQGMAIKGFTKDDISNLEIQIPSIKEQQKIAACLSSIDDLIKAQSQKIEALKWHKKGLLQGLFPDINEENPSNSMEVENDRN